jgi:hypothetical protein
MLPPPDRRAALQRDLRERVGADEAPIAREVPGFHARARTGPLPAPAFASRIAERLGAGIAAHQGLGRPGGFRLPAPG